jgi:hypothetical protein
MLMMRKIGDKSGVLKMVVLIVDSP